MTTSNGGSGVTPSSDTASAQSRLNAIAAGTNTNTGQTSSGGMRVEDGPAAPLLKWLDESEQTILNEIKTTHGWTADGKMGKTLIAGTMTKYNNDMIHDEHGTLAGHQQDLQIIAETKAALLQAVASYKHSDAQASEDFNRAMHQD